MPNDLAKQKRPKPPAKRARAIAPVERKAIEKMKLSEIAAEISERLRQLENDPVRNPVIDGHNKHFYFAQAYAAGR
jgi:hypothetical protein